MRKKKSFMQDHKNYKKLNRKSRNISCFWFVTYRCCPMLRFEGAYLAEGYVPGFGRVYFAFAVEAKLVVDEYNHSDE